MEEKNREVGVRRSRSARARVAQAFNEREVTSRWGVEAPVPEGRAIWSARAGSELLAVVSDGFDRGEEWAGRVEQLRWGMVPFWTPREDVEAGRRALWARSETLWERASFRLALQSQRCVVPISGWYATVRDGQADRTIMLRPKNGGVWNVAALWDEWIGDDGRALRTLALVSTEANARLAPLGLRMPAVLREGDDWMWLRARRLGEKDTRRALSPLASREMVAQAVSAPRWREQDDETLATPLKSSDAIIERLGLSRPASQIAIRRTVSRDWKSEDGQVFFRTRSFTREDSTRWHPVVDTHDGTVFCDCPDFHYRHARHAPSVHTPDHWCKHLCRAAGNCLKHGDLQRQAAH